MAIPNQTAIAIDQETKDMIKALAKDRPIYIVVKEIVKRAFDELNGADTVSVADKMTELAGAVKQLESRLAKAELFRRGILELKPTSPYAEQARELMDRLEKGREVNHDVSNQR